jgi:hypothetical protein
MKALAVVLTVFSCLVLAAHFLRAGHVAETGLCAALPLLLLVRRRWVVRLMQAVLVAGAGVWVWTTFVLLREYLQVGRALVHLIATPAVLSTVALVALLAARLLQHLLPPRP